MTRFILAAGVAALAITAPAAAKPGEGGGHGGGDKGQSAKAERGGGHQAAKAQGGGFKAQSANGERRGGGQRFVTVDRGGKGHARKFERHDNKVAKFDRGHGNSLRIRGDDRIRGRGDDRFDSRFGDRFATRGLNDGCPPGLAKKHNGCMPPGQLKNSLLGLAIPAAYRDSIVPRSLRDLYRDNDEHYYRYGDGYMYRVDRRNNLVDSLLPLLGGGYAAGQMFPSAYSNYYVPQQYQAFYPDSSDSYYRYNNGYVYQVDRGTSLIQALIPLLTGGSGIGQMLPQSYSSYNVPYQYRSMYYDTPDYNYRYAPGAIYQVDPRSNLITGMPMLLANDLSVGAPLPLGYDAYNVPMAYRDDYYDSQTAMYRYNDGYIYQVDPTTRLITAVINAIV